MPDAAAAAWCAIGAFVVAAAAAAAAAAAEPARAAALTMHWLAGAAAEPEACWGEKNHQKDHRNRHRYSSH